MLPNLPNLSAFGAPEQSPPKWCGLWPCLPLGRASWRRLGAGLALRWALGAALRPRERGGVIGVMVSTSIQTDGRLRYLMAMGRG